MVTFPLLLFLFGTPNKCGHATVMDARRNLVKKAWKERQNHEPRYLPPRRRALSSERNRGETGTSGPSPFLSLPREIRQQTFLEVLGIGVIHLVQLPSRLGHIRCTKGHAPATHNRHLHLPRACFTGEIQIYHRCEVSAPLTSTDACLPLPKTCRKVYCEAVDVLYATNSFDINHPITLHFLVRTIRPQRLKSIRYSQITWTDPSRWSVVDRWNYDAYPDGMATWDAMWDAIGRNMTGLRSLKRGLQIDPYDFSYWPCPREDYLDRVLAAPRQKVKGLQSFELEISDSTFWNCIEAESQTQTLVCESS